MERVARIELARRPWEGHRLPLHHTRALWLVLMQTVFRLKDTLGS